MAPTEPSPKRQKLTPTEERPPILSPGKAPSTTGSIATPSKSPQSSNEPSTPNSVEKRSSWYSRTWPRKAVPVTEVARESISSASSIAAETASILRDKVKPAPSRKSSLALTLGRQSSAKSLPADVATTTDHATQSKGKRALKSPNMSVVEDVQKGTETPPPPAPESPVKAANGDEKDDKKPTGTDPPPTSETQPPSQPPNTVPRSWIGWLARTEDTKSTDTLPPEQIPLPPDKPKAEESLKKGQTSEINAVESIKQAETEQSKTDEIDVVLKQPQGSINRRSWIPLWNNATAAQSAPAISSPTEVKQEPVLTTVVDKVKDTTNKTAESTSKASSIETSLPQPQTQPNAKSSGWVFWSREQPQAQSKESSEERKGEIAIADTPSETKPKRASIHLDEAARPKREDLEVKPIDKKSKSKGKAPQGTTQDDIKVHKKQASKTSLGSTQAESSKASASITDTTPDPTIARPASPAPSKKSYEHLLLPSFRETLKLPDNQSLLQRLANLFYAVPEPNFKHLNLIKDPPRIKNALAIGVHGYFPAPLIRTVLGQPTGTSIKFAEMAAKSIQRWTKTRGYECKVESAALEGEGKIADRVELLWKLMLNWIEKIRKADFVLVACHSQGVPVAIMLVAKLIHFGCLSASRVGICAMAGVNMGPFAEFKSRWISGSAGELFEFSDPTSKVSTDYQAALEDVLKFGVRVTYVGSIDDQLVSLESSVNAPVSHPHIYRAVSIDSRVHAPSFLSHLVAFALKLRNLGVQDHGLIKELSGPLAGSLYSGEGHSRIYEDDAVYDLAVSFALETTSSPDTPVTRRNIVSSAANPYILPFAMRGMLEEDFVKSDLQQEAEELLKQFDEWRPTTKVLKDVKFRLEGIRSKL